MKKNILLTCFIICYSAFGNNINFSLKKGAYNSNKIENDSLVTINNDTLHKKQVILLKKAFQKEISKLSKKTYAQKFKLYKNKKNSQVNQLEGILSRLNNKKNRKQTNALEFDKEYVRNNFTISENEKEILDKAKEVTDFVEKNNRFADVLSKLDPSKLPIAIKQNEDDDYKAIIVIDELKIEDLADSSGKEPKLTIYAKVTLEGTQQVGVAGKEEEQVLYFYNDDVDISATGGVPDDTRLYLLTNVALTKGSSNWLLTLSRGVDPDGSLNKAASSVTISCTGVTKFNYALDVRLSRKLVIPTDEEGGYTCAYDQKNRKSVNADKKSYSAVLKTKRELLKKAKKDKDASAVKTLEADIKKYDKLAKETKNKGVDQSVSGALKKGVKDNAEINKLKATKTKLEKQRKEKETKEKKVTKAKDKKKLSKQLKSLDTNIKRLADQIERKTNAKKSDVKNELTGSGKALDESAVGNPCYVGAKVNFQGSSLGDFVVDLTLPNFEAVNLPGYTFSLEQLVFDNSVKKNSENFDLSDEYKEKIGDGEKTWQGFYAKKLKVILPEKLSKFGNSKSDSRRAVEVEGLVVDKRGVTGDFAATNVLGIEDGKIGDFAVSIDKLKLRILTNTFYGVELEGNLKIPLVDSTMVYSGKYDKEEFAAKIELENETVFTAKAIRSRLTLKENSYIQLEYKNDSEDDGAEKEWLPEASLTGSLEVVLSQSDSKSKATATKSKEAETTSEKKKEFITVGGVTFEELKITKDDIDFKSIGIKKGTKMKSFPIQLNELTFIKPSKGEYGLKVDVGLSLMKETKESKDSSSDKKEMTGFSASGAFHVYAKRTEGKYKYDRFEFKKIELKGEFAKLGIDGSIEYMSDDPVYGNGFKGAIELDIKTLDAKVMAEAVFGTTKNKQKKDFKYWYFDVAYINTKEQDPSSPKKFDLRMLMGGANYQMAQKTKSGNDKESDDTEGSNNSYIPDYSKGLGFRAGIGFSLQGSSTLSAMALLNMQFTKSWGVSRIQIIGAGGLMTKPEPVDKDDKNLAAAQEVEVEEDSSKGSLEVALKNLDASSYIESAKIGLLLGIDLDFENNIYQGVLEGYMNTPAFKGGGENGKLGRISFYYAKGKKWYVFAGDRKNRLDIQVPIPVLQPLEARIGAYFMTGQNMEGAKKLKSIPKVNSPIYNGYDRIKFKTDLKKYYNYQAKLKEASGIKKVISTPKRSYEGEYDMRYAEKRFNSRMNVLKKQYPNGKFTFETVTPYYGYDRNPKKRIWRHYIEKKTEYQKLSSSSNVAEFYKFGAIIGLRIEGDYGIAYWDFKTNIDLNVDIAKYNDGVKKCVDNTERKVGDKNGWFTSGDVGVELSGKVGVKVVGKKYGIVDGSITARLNFELPNNTMLGGQAKAKYRVGYGWFSKRGTAKINIVMGPKGKKPCSFKY